MKPEGEEVYRDRTIYLIARIREKANRLITRELAAHGLTGVVPTHGDILVSLFLQPRLPMKRLAEIIDRDKSTITALVDKLVRLGYVEKKPDPNDSRVALVCLTTRGRALMPDFLEISSKLQERVYKNLSRKERAVLIELLRKVNEDW
jgi:DNA-binding MarR family transcriptional regulator